MSITIKSDQLNLLVYKYLLESNLSHTAFSLFNEARLESSVSQYKFDIKAGHLVSLLEKALIFNQIQSHITMNDYEQCQEPFYLLKSHICRITEKAKVQKQKLLQKMTEDIYTTMRRTSSIHNTLVPNKEYEDIIYDQRSASFFDKSAVQLSEAGKVENFHLGGNGQYLWAKGGPHNKTCLSVMEIVDSKHISLFKVLPCYSSEQAYQLKKYKILPNSDTLIRVYHGNICEINSISSDNPGNFIGIPLADPIEQILPNPKTNSLLTFLSTTEYCVVYFASDQQQKCLKIGKGKFLWLNSHQFLIAEEKNVKKMSLKNPEDLKTFISPIDNVDKIRISVSQIYFSIQSISEGIACVYTFEKQEPLYIFDYSSKNPCKEEMQPQNTPISNTSSSEQLKQICWYTINSTDCLLILTDYAIKSFQIELNNYSKIIEIEKYDKMIRNFVLLKKSQSQDHYVVCLGMNNIVVCDMGFGKIQRVECGGESSEIEMYEIEGNQLVGLKMNNRVYLLSDENVQALFA